MSNTAAEIPTAEDWKALWQSSGLEERTVTLHTMDPREEIRSLIRWIGWRWVLRAWGCALWLFLTRPAARRAMKEQLDTPREATEYMGYGLFTGTK